MSQHALELCTLLVNDIYGELSSRVFSTLLRYGRLPLPALIHHAHLPPRQLKHGLAVLIQQHLVLHYTSPEDETTQYEADWKNAYALVRSGKVIKLAEGRFGESAGGIISNLLLLGHAKVGDLVDAYGLGSSKTKSSVTAGVLQVNGKGLPNGMGNPHENSKSQDHFTCLGDLHTTLHTLFHAGFVAQVREGHFRSPVDSQNEAERAVMREKFPTGVKGTNAKMDFDKTVRERLIRWRDGSVEVNGINGFSHGMKRPSSTPMTNGSKRAKIRHGFANASGGHMGYEKDHDSLYLDENLVVRVNSEKFAVAMRSEQLVELSKRYIGETTSLVYAELLRQLEEKIRWCHDDLAVPETLEEEEKALPTVSTLEISANLSHEIDLASAIGGIADSQPVSDQAEKRSQNRPKKRRKRRRLDEDETTVEGEASADEGEGDEDEDIPKIDNDGSADDYLRNEVKQEPDEPDMASYSSDRQNRMMNINQHLQLLLHDSRRFVIRHGSRGLGEWKVNFRALTKMLRQMQLENTISQRFGGVATRLVRILIDKGKLDEKQVATMGLLKQKEIRSTLTAMHEAGHIELQEIPRDNNRQPSRTMYLWYFDPERCRQLMLEETYKAMARALQRAKEERTQVQSVIAKAERTDVVGKEDQYLSISERVALQRWRDKEEMLIGEVGRMDTMVGILRDF
ncbi:MAG: RNA polymerase III subunit C82 [Pycnora praestabilis]|nr:MAG: RNA polymerase III subunit C82 [Pycnora praestabilis]